MNEQGYEQTPEQAEDRKRTEAEEAEYEGIDEDIEQIIKAAGQLPEGVNPMDLIMVGIRPVLREMAPEERRRFCADMATCGSPSNNNNKTGRFFNGFKSARGLAEPDYKELGRKIMEKRNPHYRPDNQ